MDLEWEKVRVERPLSLPPVAAKALPLAALPSCADVVSQATAVLGKRTGGERKQRFTPAEQAAIGRRTFARKLSGLGGRSSSLPVLEDPQAAAGVSSQGAADFHPSASSRPRQRSRPTTPPLLSVAIHAPDSTLRPRSSPQAAGDANRNQAEQERLKAAISRLLPTSASAPTLPGLPGAQRKPSPVSPLPPVPTSTLEAPLPKEALDKYRLALLRRFKCLFDVRKELERHITLDKPVGPKELRGALLRIDPEGGCDELLFGKDGSGRGLSKQRGGSMTAADLFRWLARSSPEAALWELRCRLIAQSLWPQSFRKAQAAVLEMLAPSPGGQASRQDLDRAGGAAAQLDRREWLQLCDRLGLTQMEASVLFRRLACSELSRDESSGTVDLRSMFEEVYALASPGLSLTRFIERALQQYGGLRQAFEAAADPEEEVLLAEGFLEMAQEVGVEARFAKKFWCVLNFGVEKSGCGEDEALEEASKRGLDEVSFLTKMLRWKPDGVLEALKDSLLKAQGSLADARLALKREGLAGGASLSPRSLTRGLKNIGAKDCDADMILAVVSEARGGDHGGAEVALEDVFELLRDLKEKRRQLGGEEEKLRRLQSAGSATSIDLDLGSEGPVPAWRKRSRSPAAVSLPGSRRPSRSRPPADAYNSQRG
eukprot:TRINITY_DN32128_c0_g1_i1.p1 TRINITY_DN32128_c0_g1~~TRINITY_DN32128_c0_g1_i1.p1  ORF type:complete len:656 (+),score=171.95 TRINITY_DN32128_c0_g1_i1:50-2017(+)